MKDSWESGDPYERFMGRWSRLVAEKFVNWLDAPRGLTWIDVGCGSGALSEAIAGSRQPAVLVALDQSQGFVESARRRLGSRVNCVVGDALDIDAPDSGFDLSVSGLVLNFIPEPEKMLAEMKRVTAPGGVVAVYVWDYAGRMDFLNGFWDSVVELAPDASELHEGRRFPDANAAGLTGQFESGGLPGVTVEAIEIPTLFASFDDYWQPFLGGQGPAGTYVSKLDHAARENLEARLRERLQIRSDGSIDMAARAWCAKCEV